MVASDSWCSQLNGLVWCVECGWEAVVYAEKGDGHVPKFGCLQGE